MSVTGVALILFLTFHCCMNVVALFSGEAYNIANPDEFVSIYELAKILEKLFSYRKLKVIQRERKDSGYSSSLVESNPTVNVDKLRQLGWNSNISIEEGFQRMINAIEF